MMISGFNNKLKHRANLLRNFLLIILVICVLLFSVKCFKVLNYYYHIIFSPPSLLYLPKGDLIKKYYSPDKKYLVNIFRSSGGATTDFSVRGEVVYLLGKKDHSRDKRTFYWQYGIKDVNVMWVSSRVIDINGRKIDLEKDSYDYRVDN